MPYTISAWIDDDDYDYWQEEEASTEEEALAIAATMTEATIVDPDGFEVMIDGEIVENYKEFKANYLAEQAKKEAEKKARLATYGDKTDRDNINKIVSYFNGYAPLMDYNPANAAWDIWKTFPGWHGEHPSGGRYTINTGDRKYEFQLVRGRYVITADDVKRIY